MNQSEDLLDKIIVFINSDVHFDVLKDRQVV